MSYNAQQLRELITLIEGVSVKEDKSSDIFSAKDLEPPKEKKEKPEPAPKKEKEPEPKPEPKQTAPNIDKLTIKPATTKKLGSHINHKIFNKAVPIPKHHQKAFKSAINRLADIHPVLNKAQADALILVLSRVQDILKKKINDV